MTSPLRFRPIGIADNLRFALSGRRAIAGALRRLSRVPQDAAPAQRHEVESREARVLLGHLRVQLDIQGLEHARGGPFVIAALHEGVADALCLALLPLPARFVARSEIFGWPRIGAAISNLGHVSIDPERGAGACRSLYREARACRDRGESLAVFPQGTLLGIETAFRSGAFRVAARLGMPILPVALSGTSRIWEHPFSPRLRYGVAVSMRVFPAVPSDADTPDGLRERISEMLKASALGQHAGPGRDQADAPPAPARRYVPERDGWWDGFAFEIDPRFAALAQRVSAHRRGLATARDAESQLPI